MMLGRHSPSIKGGESYVIKSCAMLRCLNNLDGSQIADIDSDISRQWHLRHTESARIRTVGGANDLEGC